MRPHVVTQRAVIREMDADQLHDYISERVSLGTNITVTEYGFMMFANEQYKQLTGNYYTPKTEASLCR